MTKVSSLLLVSLLLGWSPGAHAMLCDGSGPVATAAGGSTSLFFTVDLDALDVDVSATGGATVGAAGEFILPISGGDASGDPLVGSIDHAGSGLEFDFGTASVEVEDMEFDFTGAIVNGELSAGPLELSTGVFDLEACAAGGCVGPGGTIPTTGYGLFLRTDAADFFENVVLGDGFDDGDQIAWAEVHVTPVPEPMLLSLLGVGLAAIGMVRRPRVA